MTTKQKEKTPLMIRGDQLMLALRIMFLCRGYRMKGLSRRKTMATFRRIFGDDKDEETFCNFANWDGVVRDMLYHLLHDSRSLMTAKWNIETFERHSPYANSSAGIRPVLQLIASDDLTEADFRSKGGA